MSGGSYRFSILWCALFAIVACGQPRLPAAAETEPSLTREAAEILALDYRGQWEDLDRLSAQHLQEFERRFGADAPETLEMRDRRVLAFVRSGTIQHPDSVEFIQATLAMRQSRLPDDHIDLSISWNHLAIARMAGSQVEEAIAHWERALETRAKHEPEGSAYTAKILANLAHGHRLKGRHEESLEYARRSLAMRERLLGPAHPDTAVSWEAVGRAWANLGAYSAARDAHERGLSIRESVLGSEHVATSGSLRGLCSLLQQTADLPDALHYCNRALATYERTLPPNHPTRSDLLMQIGEIQSRSFADGEALESNARALAILEANHGTDGLELAPVLTRIGSLEAHLGHHRRWLEVTERVAAICAAHPEAREPCTTTAVLGLGLARSTHGSYSEAQALFQQALETARATANRFSEASALFGLALNHIRAGRWAEAVPHVLQVESMSQEEVRALAASRSPRYVRDQAPFAVTGINLAMTLLTSQELSADATTAQALLETLISRRALLLEELAAHRRALWTLDTEEGIRQRRELERAREGLARVVLEGAAGEDREAHRWRLIEARSALERVQEDAAKLAGDARSREPTAPLRAADLLGVLPEDTRLVSYVSYYDYATAPSENAVRSYLAIVSRADEPTPRVFRLGACDVIDPVIEEWRARVARDPRLEDRDPADHRAPGAKLRELLWDPIRPALEGAELVFLVPDGEIHGVDFGALPANDDAYLVETEPLLHYLAAERDLLRLVRRRYTGAGLLAVGDPDYDFDPAGRGATTRARSESDAGRPVYRSPEASCENLRSLRFTPLSGTLGEVEEISSMWSKGRRDVVVLRGPQATEEAVKDLAPGRQVVHLATHGFFMHDRCTTRPFSDGDDGDSPGAVPLKEDNPLWLSGLALASANRRYQAGFDAREDGILTSDEIAALDLSSVEWVVLSSCASGHDGDYFYNEGVQGLHRAFHLAGAGAVITSLWPVEDEAARAWMTELYAARSSGLSTPRSVRHASLARIRSLRDAQRSAHPLHWAGFVAAGDWR